MGTADLEGNSKLNLMLMNMVQSTFIDEGKLIIDKDGLILHVNIKNLSLDIGDSTNFLEFLTSKVTLHSGQPIVLKGGSSTEDIEFSTKNESEHFRLLIWSINYEERYYFMSQVFSITKSKHAFQRLSNRRKSVENEMLLRTQEIMHTEKAMSEDGGFLTNFLRGLRHDLLSPITQLKEIFAFYQKETDPIKKQKAEHLTNESLEKLFRTAHGFSEFVDLHFVHREKKKKIELKTLIDEVCEVMKSEIAEGNAIMSIELKHKQLIFFNRKILQSIVYNLLSNAIKFRSDKRTSKIELTSYDEHDRIMLEIKDNGIGIDMKRQGDKLFKPFTRLTTDRQGAGIGLSMVQNILNKNNGGIEIESELDSYTKVAVSLPTE